MPALHRCSGVTVAGDLARLLAALGAPDLGSPRPAKRPPGRPPALTPAQVASIRRRRALPLAERPRLSELAVEFGVHRETVRQAAYALGVYADGEPAPHGGGPHRDRGSGRFCC